MLELSEEKEWLSVTNSASSLQPEAGAKRRYTDLLDIRPFLDTRDKTGLQVKPRAKIYRSSLYYTYS